MNIADIITEYGAYYEDAGQNAQRLSKQLYFQNDFDQLFTIRESNDSVYRLGSAAVGRLAQPFQKAFTPTGAATFTPQPIQTYRVKVDFEDYPDELEESWLGFLQSEDHDRSKWPFVKWLLEEHITPRFNEDILLNEAFSGVYAAPTPGTPGGAGTAMDGIRKIINDHITAGDITPIATGAWDADPATFVTQVETFVKAIPQRYRKQKMSLIMNDDLHVRFQEGMIAKYNMNYNQADLDLVRLYKNITVVGTEVLGNSAKIWCTPKENQYCIWKHGKKQGTYGIESEDRKVKIWNDFRKGYGFVIPQIVYTNDQDLV